MRLTDYSFRLPVMFLWLTLLCSQNRVYKHNRYDSSSSVSDAGAFSKTERAIVKKDPCVRRYNHLFRLFSDSGCEVASFVFKTVGDKF